MENHRGARSERIRLLLMDDEEDVLLLLELNAELNGAFDVVATARDGDEAVSLARALRPDVVILDHLIATASDAGVGSYRSPMTGLESVQYLRSFLPAALIAVYSGKRGIEHSAAEVGADLHFVKGDTDVDTMLETVAAAWHAAR